MIQRNDRIAGGLLGLLVGDALGVPYEFNAPEHLPPVDQLEFDPPSGFERSHKGVPPGTWSDDGAQALCLLASLLECGAFDAEDFGKRIVRWYDEGYMAVNGEVFDVGITTGSAIRRMRAGTPALSAGPSGQSENGNGALMRVLPLVLWHRGADEELVRDARMQSRVTHGHLRSQLCCAYYCLGARGLLNEAADPWKDALATLRKIIAEDAAAVEELEFNIRPESRDKISGSGYVVDCLRSACFVQAAGAYEAVVKAAVALGHDTDTTACVAGGLAGIRDGASAIPERWLSRLHGRELYEPLLKSLLARE